MGPPAPDLLLYPVPSLPPCPAAERWGRSLEARAPDFSGAAQAPSPGGRVLSSTCTGTSASLANSEAESNPPLLGARPRAQAETKEKVVSLLMQFQGVPGAGLGLGSPALEVRWGAGMKTSGFPAGDEGGEAAGFINKRGGPSFERGQAVPVSF